MQTNEIVRLYTIDHLTMQEIAIRYNVSRQAIWKHLKKAGVNSKDGTQVAVKCASCGKKLIRIRYQWRKGDLSYCRQSCYYDYIKKNGYSSSYSRRIARAVVSEFFSLDKDNVVHHVDKNHKNNDISNLWLFTNQAEHMEYHRTGRGKPIWIGSKNTP